MTVGLFRDEYGWVKVDYGGVQAPMLRDKYIASGCQPPYALLPTVASPSLGRVNDPERWRDCAEEARAVAEQMLDPEAFATMLEVAEHFDELAQRAERRCGRFLV